VECEILREVAMVVSEELMKKLSSGMTRRLRLQVGRAASAACHSLGYQQDEPSKVKGRQ